MTGRDPGAMTQEERTSEIASVLATGFLRLLARRKELSGAHQDCLADRAPVEPSCDAVNDQRNKRGDE